MIFGFSRWPAQENPPCRVRKEDWVVDKLDQE